MFRGAALADFEMLHHRYGRSSRLRDLMRQARGARRGWRRTRFPAPRRDGSFATGPAAERRRAALLIERMLTSRLPPVVDCSRYLQILAGRQQKASRVIARLMVSVEAVVLGAVVARALAVALCDLLHFIEAGCEAGDAVGIYLAVALDDDHLVVGLGADGDISPLACASATRSMNRASALVELLGGDFQRGVENGRMVFGLTFPRSIVVQVA